MKSALPIIVIQLLGLAVVLFGDVGFDKVGKHGLDFNHFLGIAAIEVIAFMAAVWLSVVKKSWAPVSMSALILVVGVLTAGAI